MYPLRPSLTLTNLIVYFEEITKWVDEGSPVDIIYLDFQKTIDKAPHQILILKLKSHGIGSEYNKLDRIMAYETNGCSEWRAFKLETSFQWGTTSICTRAYLIVNIHQ